MSLPENTHSPHRWTTHCYSSTQGKYCHLSNCYRLQRNCPWRWMRLTSMSHLWTSPLPSPTNLTQKRSSWSLWRSIRGAPDDIRGWEVTQSGEWRGASQSWHFTPLQRPGASIPAELTWLCWLHWWLISEAAIGSIGDYSHSQAKPPPHRQQRPSKSD